MIRAVLAPVIHDHCDLSPGIGSDISGRRTLPAEATLKIPTPTQLEATGAFTYACR